GGDAAGDILTDIENLVGSGFADSLTGDSGANVLSGGGGDDVIYFTTGGDPDTVDGGSGGDTLDVTGTSGSESFFIETAADYNSRTGAGYAGLAEIIVSEGNGIQAEVTEIEKMVVHGGAGDDTLTLPGSLGGTPPRVAGIIFYGGDGDDT